MVSSSVARCGVAPGAAAAREASIGKALGFFWALIWLFWLYIPLLAAWRERSIAGGIAIIGFAVVYVWHFFRRAWRFGGGEASRSRAETSAARSAARYVLLMACAAVALVSVGEPATACLVFTAITSMWTFPTMVAFTVAAANAGIYLFLTAVVPGWSLDYGMPFWMAFGVLACFASLLGATRQRALEVSRQENAVLLVQEERNKMARDLHDILGHSLTVITVKAELAGRLIDVDPVKAGQQIAELEQLSRGALADVRRTVTGYREISLAGELARARSALADKGISADLPGSVDDVEPDLRELFAWTVREATTNVIRHSGARRCSISVEPTSITVTDDGVGPGLAKPGNGLAGLRERAESLGAEMTTSATAGFMVKVSAPQHFSGEEALV